MSICLFKLRNGPGPIKAIYLRYNNHRTRIHYRMNIPYLSSLTWWKIEYACVVVAIECVFGHEMYFVSLLVTV